MEILKGEHHGMPGRASNTGKVSRGQCQRCLGDVKRIPITAFRTLHSGERESPMNFVYLCELDGWRVFHDGDSAGRAEQYQRLGLGFAPIDLALVHYCFLLEPDCARFFQEVVEPGHIALTHLPIQPEDDVPGNVVGPEVL